jgi:ribosomal RNA assembly protein
MRLVTLPGKRFANFAGKQNKALKDLQDRVGVKISVTTESNRDDSIRIDGEPEGEWLAEQVLKAVDLGFAPKDAFKLLKDDNYLEQVDIEQSMRGNSRGVERQKARIIGTEGKAKRTIEELSEAKLALSDGPMLGIIGGFDEASAAKEAILQLLEGRPHQAVYAYLEGQKRKREARRLGVHV